MRMKRRSLRGHAVRVPTSATALVMAALSVGLLVTAAQASAPVWRLVASSAPHGGALQGVSCPRSGACRAVGTSSLAFERRPAFAEIETSGGWRRYNSLVAGRGVACSSKSSCFAVAGGLSRATADHWNGRSWKKMPMTAPAAPYGDVLSSVSCRSARSCFAVGATTAYTTNSCPAGHSRCLTDEPLLERWNGREWQNETVPKSAETAAPSSASGDPVDSQGAFSSLQAVSCATRGPCIAVGDSGKGSPATRTSPLSLRWSGHRWETLRIPSPRVSGYVVFDSISCSTASACTAVGTYGTTAYHPFAERWDGRVWRLERTPTPAGARVAELNGISCPGTGLCIAVGSSTHREVGRPLVERWSAGKWKVMNTPLPPRSNRRGGSVLTSVSCALQGSCTAVGDYGRSQQSGWFIERYGSG